MNSEVTLVGQFNGVNFAQGRHKLFVPCVFLGRRQAFFSVQFVFLLSNFQEISGLLIE